MNSKLSEFRSKLNDLNTRLENSGYGALLMGAILIAAFLTLTYYTDFPNFFEKPIPTSMLCLCLLINLLLTIYLIRPKPVRNYIALFITVIVLMFGSYFYGREYNRINYFISLSGSLFFHWTENEEQYFLWTRANLEEAEVYAEIEEWEAQWAKYSKNFSRMNLGWLYLEGKGTEKNEEKGLELLKQAADEGFFKAHLKLSSYYFEKQDKDNAILYLQKAQETRPDLIPEEYLKTSEESIKNEHSNKKQ